MRPINVLSFCDGISTGQQALKDAGIEVANYYAFEVDKHAVTVAKNNFPNTIHLGDLRKWKKQISKIPHKIDLVLAGVECKQWSIAGKQQGIIEGTSGDLILYAVEALLYFQPKWHVFEMTPMKEFNQRIFDLLLRSKPMMIDSALVSMQTRKRNYYSNFYFDQPKDLKLSIQKLAEPGEVAMNYSSSGRGVNGVESREYVAEKAYTLTKGGYGTRSRTYFKGKDHERELSIEDFEELQTLPRGYTKGISKNQRRNCLGNGWTKDVFVHILKHIKEKK